MSAHKPHFEIALALIWKGDRLLITRRPSGAHLAGFWEFPGGKCRDAEAASACALREALEEVGVVCRPLRTRRALHHDYPERTVRLVPIDCAWESGEPRCLAVSDFAWVHPAGLADYEFPPANSLLIAELITSAPPGSDR